MLAVRPLSAGDHSAALRIHAANNPVVS